MHINTWESQQITTTNILFIIQQVISWNCMGQVILRFIISANHLGYSSTALQGQNNNKQPFKVFTK